MDKELGFLREQTNSFVYFVSFVDSAFCLFCVFCGLCLSFVDSSFVSCKSRPFLHMALQQERAEQEKGRDGIHLPDVRQSQLEAAMHIWVAIRLNQRPQRLGPVVACLHLNRVQSPRIANKEILLQVIPCCTPPRMDRKFPPPDRRASATMPPCPSGFPPDGEAPPEPLRTPYPRHLAAVSATEARRTARE